MLLNSLEVRLGITGETKVTQALDHVKAKQKQVLDPPAHGGGSAAGHKMLNALEGMMSIMNQVAGLMAVVEAVRMIGEGIHKAVEEARAFSREVLNMQALTGATAQQAALFTTMFNVTGTQGGMRDILELTQAMKSGQGLSALSRLGVHVDAKADSLTSLMKVIEKLKEMPNGPHKAQIEMDIFGLRGVMALQGIMRLTREQMEQAQHLAKAFDGRGVEAIESMEVSMALLGQTILQGIVVPIVAALMPALETAVNWVIKLVNWVAELNKGPGIILAMAVALGVMGAAIGALVVMFGVLTTAILGTAAAQAVLDALSSNWTALAAGAAVGAAVGIGFGGWQMTHHGDPAAEATKDLHQTVKEIHATLIGGGDRTARVKSEIEADYALKRALVGGVT